MEELILFTEEEARLNVTWAGQNGDYPDPIPVDADDYTIRSLAAEAVRSGYISGIDADENVDFTDFVIDRFSPTTEVNYTRFFLRFKTPFGLLK